MIGPWAEGGQGELESEAGEEEVEDRQGSSDGEVVEQRGPQEVIMISSSEEEEGEVETSF